MKKVLALLLSVFMLLCLVACKKPSSQSSTRTGEDYESVVWEAFWEGASQSFGVEYSDYKFAHTVYSYIQDFTTTDGYTSHYYLIKTAFETKNVLGQDVLHHVTARCYYVPEYSSVVYVTYMTLDGETVLFDEEKEDWLMGMGGSGNSSATSTNDNSTSDETFSTDNSAQNNQEPNNTTNINSNSSDSNTTIQHICSYSNWGEYDESRHQRYCISCYETEYENHSWDSGKVTEQATCDAEGKKVYFCSVCNETIVESIEKIAHNFTEKVEENKYLKTRATYTAGAVYYYSCSCGEKGSDTFTLNNRIEWITTDMLEQDYNLSSSCAFGDEQNAISIFRPNGSGIVAKLVIDIPYSGSLGGAMNGEIHKGIHDGCSVRFYYELNGYGTGQFVFYYDDLVAAGIV